MANAIISMPFIYAPVVPVVILDLFVIMYESVCFPLYGLERVKRSDFRAIDRNLMTYMTPIQKMNCYYCSYVNNALSYMREVVARTEVYWCPLKEAKRRQKAHHYYETFAPTNEDVMIPNPNANQIIKQHNRSDA
ncbi:hypothetical protein KC711_07575 [Candidatus Peregrinibacteria bacterium]|nr:hypothetical protein [Candidatus Peregrinibacteria bacterium]